MSSRLCVKERGERSKAYQMTSRLGETGITSTTDTGARVGEIFIKHSCIFQSLERGREREEHLLLVHHCYPEEQLRTHRRRRCLLSFILLLPSFHSAATQSVFFARQSRGGPIQKRSLRPLFWIRSGSLAMKCRILSQVTVIRISGVGVVPPLRENEAVLSTISHYLVSV